MSARDVDEKSNRLWQTLDCGRVRKHWFSKSGFSSTSLALVMSYFTLKEELHLIQLIGSAITIVGVWLARR
ncbi:MAG: hypothetical protein AAB209_04555 [Bacteroidota bacterium]